MLPQVDVEGQEKISRSRVLIIGIGGLGSPAAIYLAAAGVGHLVLGDGDSVDLSNLQRQIVHGTNDIGNPKVLSGQQRLTEINPLVEITPIASRLDGDVLQQQVELADVVLDCSDNFSTRFAVNKACVMNKKPLVSGACIRFEGQVTVFTPGTDNSPCYNCLYADIDELGESCSQTGIIAPLGGIIGSIQALEALKLILGIGITLGGRVLLLDALTMDWNTMILKKNPSCSTCSDTRLARV